MNEPNFNQFLEKSKRYAELEESLKCASHPFTKAAILSEQSKVFEEAVDWLDIDPKMAVLLSLDLDHHGF